MAEKRVKTSEWRAMPDADLAAQLVTLRQQLWEYRVKAKNGSLQQTHLLRVTRRQLARLQTLRAEASRIVSPAKPEMRTPEGPR